MEAHFAKYPGYSSIILADAPQPGYDILEIIESSEVMTWCEQENIIAPGNSFPQIVTNTRGGVGKKVLFLLGETRDDELKRLQKQLEEEKNGANLLQQKNHLLSVEVTERNKDIANLKFYVDHSKSLDKLVTELTQKANRLEGDLAKVQRAIGELRYKEIVGAK